MRVNQPVVNGAGLVGKVKSVSDGNAVVMLLTDQEFGVSAQAAQRARAGRRSCPRSARPATCCSSSCRDAKEVRSGDRDHHRRARSRRACRRCSRAAS